MEDYCRIYGIMAREAPVCVLFRRGPSKWTQLIKWKTDSNSFEAGHWFKGRVYERRCDLSPDGRFLIYFAAKINDHTLEDANGYTYAWTAISEPPHYKAVALWPKGDCWHGGGLFKSNRDVWINHYPEASKPHPNHVPTLFSVTDNPKAWGEDEPIHSMRLERDNWKRVQWGYFKEKEKCCVTERTDIWEKGGRKGKRLRRELLEIDFKAYGGPYIERFSIIPKNGEPIEITGATWADLDQKGKLVFARSGKIFRGTLTKHGIDEKELIDLNDNKPPMRTS